MDYLNHYNLLISKHGSIEKPSGYSERHHILPKCLGGSDEANNLVYLSAEAHYVAHQLLVKMNPRHYGISYAAMLMTRVGNGKGNGRVSNKYYAWLKNKFSKLQSTMISRRLIGNTHLKGYKHTMEAKLKMSIASLGKPKSEEMKAKLSNTLKGKSNSGWLGRHHSEETKRKISESNKGKNSGKSNPKSDETKRKISIALKGKLKSEEHKANLRKPKKK